MGSDWSLTSFLHKDEEVVQELLSFGVIIQFIKLRTAWIRISNKLIGNHCGFYFFFQVKTCQILTLAKSLDGSPLIFPPSGSSAQMEPPLCKHTGK